MHRFHKSAEHVQTILHHHDGLRRLERGAVPSTQVWHLLLSLREYCKYHSLSFDDILASVKEDEVELYGEGDNEGD